MDLRHCCIGGGHRGPVIGNNNYSRVEDQLDTPAGLP
jgi:hypothetical protein